MSLIHRAGDSMIFRQNTSTPGGTVWTVEAHSIAQNFPITIAGTVTVSVSGTSQALASLGSATLRMIEVGIDGLGRPYAWASGAQVILGDALADGEHAIAFLVHPEGWVEVIADAAYYGNGFITPGFAVDRFCLGVSCLGTLAWQGTYDDVRVYADGDLEAAAGAMGVAGERPFVPSMLFIGSTAALWMDLDATGAVELNTQPVVPDVTNPANWTPLNSALLSHVGGALRVAENGAINPFGRGGFGGVTGNRQLTTAVGRNDSSANDLSLVVGSGANRLRFSTNIFESKTLENTLAGTVIDVGYYDGVATPAWWGELQSATAKNLSIKKVVCKGNLGDLVQATPANMPWSSDPDAPTSVPVNGRRVMYFATDFLMSSAGAGAFSFLHSPAGSAAYIVVTTHTTGTSILFSTIATTADYGVMIILDVLNQWAIMRYSNNTGGFDTFTTASGPILPSTRYLLELHISAAGAMEFLVNGVVRQSGNPALLSVIPGTKTFHFCAGGTGAGPGTLVNHEQFYVGRALSNTERATERQYLAAKHGVVLP